MTTILQHSINPLTRAPHYNFAVNHPFIIHQHFFYQESQACLHRVVYSSMDKILESRNIESMRKMMLMQDQLFKQQVQELHRLYNLQKKLMHEIENGQSFHAFTSRDDPKELSGSNSGESSRVLINFDLETPAESTPSSIHPFEEQKGLKKMDEETDVEVDLTLSIGHSTRKVKQRSKSHLHKCSTQLQDSDQSNEVQKLGSSSAKTNEGEECRELISSSSVYEENTRPRWLLQDLSLNRT